VAALVDTNLLLRSLNSDDPHYEAAASALAKLRLRTELCIAPQNLIEFWAVATRPRKLNGLGMTTAEAETEITSIRQLFRVLPYTPAVLEAWQGIVTRYGVAGKQTHDAHLVAVMQVHAVTEILTFNTADFSRFAGITALDPALVQN
jgi:predicted nucleic acid-binding protein